MPPASCTYEPPERQYQAAYELAFRNQLDMERFFASPEYAAALRDEPRFVAAGQPLPGAHARTPSSTTGA